MRFFARNSMKRIYTLCSLICCMFLLNGCAMYDWLCSWIQTTISETKDYEVSVVDCKHFKMPNEILSIVPRLSAHLSDSVREGVSDLSQLPKFRNIRLVDRIPKSQFVQFQNEFFTDKTSYLDRVKILRNYCDTYGTNIVVWGATMGDDAGMAFIGWMYRRDLDVITKTSPQPLTVKMSERVQEHTVKVAISNLLKGSLEGRPIGGDGKVADAMIDNKNKILEATGTALMVVVMALPKLLENRGDE
jgi:hypothetical protein